MPADTTEDSTGDAAPGSDGPTTGVVQTPPAGVPSVDLTTAVVDPADVWFDTFDGSATRLTEASADLIEDLRDKIPPINVPAYRPADEVPWLGGDDLVVGYATATGAWAFPVRILNIHELVIDEFDDTPVLVSYCPLCASGVVYDRRVAGRELTFGNTSALYDSDLVMYDHATGSYWWQVAGRAIVGELAGTELTALPSSTTAWSSWRQDHPSTVVLGRPGGRTSPYDGDRHASLPEQIDRGEFRFPVRDEVHDARLNASTRVLGLVIAGDARAYPLARLAGQRVEDTVGGTPVVVEVAADGSGATASRVTEGGSLEPLASRTSFWFAFAAAFPHATVVT